MAESGEFGGADGISRIKRERISPKIHKIRRG